MINVQIQLGDRVAVQVADRYTEIGLVKEIRGPLFLVNGRWFLRERVEPCAVRDDGSDTARLVADIDGERVAQKS